MTLEIRNLSKAYKDLEALKDLNFKLESSECLALLGPNGAGKTTAIKALVTLLQPDSGEFLWQGKNLFREPQVIRDLVGYISQEIAMDKVLTGLEFMKLSAGLLHMPWKQAKDRALELLEKLDLSEASNRRVGEYSGGMKRRLDLAAALLHDPKVLILDEPTTGLDIEARELIWKLLADYGKQGGRMILVSHDFREIDALAQQILILKKGQTAVQGTPSELRATLGQFIVRIQTKEFMDQASIDQVKKLFASERSTLRWLEHEEAAIFAYQGETALVELQQQLHQKIQAAGLGVHLLNVQHPSLEDVYRFAVGEVA